MTDSESGAVATAAHGVTITDAAAEKVRKLLEQEGRDDLRLRVAVQPGGCSGLIYQLYFDERFLDGDATVDFDGGGRVRLDMTDRELEEVKVKMPVEMTFRKTRFAGGIYGYWWKCRPVRD